MKFCRTPKRLITAVYAIHEREYESGVTAHSLTNALGWSGVINRLRTDEKSPVVEPKEFLPFVQKKDEAKQAVVSVSEKTKAIAKKLDKEGILPDRLAIYLVKLGVLGNG